MNRKTSLIILSVILVIIAATLIYFFWPKKPTETPTPLPSSQCLVFQSDDATRPCYILPSTSATKPVSGGGQSTPTLSSFPGIASSTPAALSECVSAGNTFERNDCVTQKAVTTKNASLCTFVAGSLAQTACVRDTGANASIVPPAVNTPYEIFLRSIPSTPPLGKSSVVSSPQIFIPTTVSTSTDSRFTAEGFVERYASVQALSVFALSRYQAKPGDRVTVYGAGFIYPTSVHVGANEFSGLKSDDGVSLSFVAPSSSGEYDVWVSNSKGSSLSASPAAKLLVTDSPLPIPQVTSVTPSVATYSDTITISGTGFAADNTLSTSLGFLEHVGASGNVMQIRVSDLPVASQVKDAKGVKGKKLSIGLYVGNKAGFNPDPFYFDVQF